MQTYIQNITIKNYLKNDENLNNVRNEIIAGLQAEKKYISSKFFYDKRGSELFEEITGLNEYYPTQTEKSVLKRIAPLLASNIRNTNIIELGSGDCSKISILLDAISADDLETVTYIPVDISRSAIMQSANKLAEKFPDLKINGIVADFFGQSDFLKSKNRNLICFFGSTIGNFTKQQAADFLLNISKNMKPEDNLILGLDMVKDISVIERAYNDDKLVTQDFNKNILNVVNELIVSDFNLCDFKHYAFFNTKKSRIEMHLIAEKDVYVKAKNSEPILIKKGEHIHTENSYKFTETDIVFFEQHAELTLKEIYTDEKKYFSECHFVK